jgi:hypothetical protein
MHACKAFPCVWPLVLTCSPPPSPSSVLAASPPRLSQGGPAPYRLPPFPPGGSAPRPAPLPLLDLSLPGPALQGAPTSRLGPVQPSILDRGFPAQGLPPSAAPQLTRELTFDLRVGQGEAAHGAGADGEEEGAGGQAGRGEEGTGAEETEGRTVGEGGNPAAAHGEAEDLVRDPAAVRIRGRLGAVLSDTDPFEFEDLGAPSDERDSGVSCSPLAGRSHWM